MHNAHFWAMLIALGVCAAGAFAHQAWTSHDQDPHSPDPGFAALSWLKRLVGRDSGHDSDLTVSDDDQGSADGDDPYDWEVEDHEWGAIIRPSGDTQVEVRPPDLTALSPLEDWVRRQIDAGARSVDIVRGAGHRFRASESTVRRAIRKVR